MRTVPLRLLPLLATLSLTTACGSETEDFDGRKRGDKNLVIDEKA